MMASVKQTRENKMSAYDRWLDEPLHQQELTEEYHEYLDDKASEILDIISDSELFTLFNTIKGDVNIGLYLLATACNRDKQHYLDADTHKVSNEGIVSAMRLALESDNDVRYAAFEAVRQQVEASL